MKKHFLSLLITIMAISFLSVNAETINPPTKNKLDLHSNNAPLVTKPVKPGSVVLAEWVKEQRKAKRLMQQGR
ncbi:TPA: hypothetical protein DDZ86_00225 [Candidatus Dependentiae bacterium]|nr:MAG: hypothetical protein UW09_C0002G0076 [candidate division TM6 bacterium GW2011_GWF2_43_87]HBL98054.1 hypothetical protein [Candidatus Dependentiae bacterium]